MITTSWVNNQAYKEIKEDGHPIVIISGADIVTILREKGIATRESLFLWLNKLEKDQS